MSLSLAIAVVVLADLALIGLLAFVMSRAARLTPHRREVHRSAAPARLARDEVASDESAAWRPSHARAITRGARASASSRS